MKKSPLVFDFDGVLVDSAQYYCRCIEQVAKQLGGVGSYTVEDLGLVTTLRYRAFLQAFGLPSELHTVFAQRLRHAFHADPCNFTPIGPLVAALRQTAPSRELRVLSANDQDLIQRWLQQQGLHGHLSIVRGGAHSGQKIDVLQQWNKELDGIVFIGDTVSDAEQALAADVEFVAVSWGWQKAELLKQHKVPVASNPEELCRWLGLS